MARLQVPAAKFFRLQFAMKRSPTPASVRPPAADARTRTFDELVRDVRACTACARMNHTHALGQDNGRIDATVLFVAEAVGRRGGAITGVPLTRDETGRRFEAFLAIAGLSRDEIFVTNAVLCHPADAAGLNRTPSAAEVARCSAFLQRTLDLVRARLVVALGRVALESLRAIAPHDARLAVNVGRPLRWYGRILVPMYHPGRQATLHRPHHLQDSDWRDLGDIARAMTTASASSVARR